MDNRADAQGIARLFLGLGVAVVIIWVVNLVTDPMFDYLGRQPPDATGAQGTQWLQAGIDFLPLFFLLVSFFGLVAYSVFKRQVVG